jgi:SAM-dependent methyltransferase
MTQREYATPFSVLHAASLLSQTSRIRKLREAIYRVVKSDDYVIDLGTGSGILAILAAREGARVTAIDINQDSLRYAKAAAELNGVAENIEFVHSHFLEYSPSEQADVVMCEMLSSIMLVEQQISATNYAVENLLKPSGHIIPEDVRLFVGPVQNKIIWDRFEIEGLLFPRIPQTAEPGQSTDLADFSELAYFDLRSYIRDTKIVRDIDFHIVQEGTIHGLQGLFESKLYEDISLTMEDGWRDLFMPLQSPIDVKEGDIIRIRISFTAGEYDSLQIEPLIN